MKNFFNTIISIFESFGKARAATALTRIHKYEEARKIMQS